MFFKNKKKDTKKEVPKEINNKKEGIKEELDVLGLREYKRKKSFWEVLTNSKYQATKTSKKVLEERDNKPTIEKIAAIQNLNSILQSMTLDELITIEITRDVDLFIEHLLSDEVTLNYQVSQGYIPKYDMEKIPQNKKLNIFTIRRLR